MFTIEIPEEERWDEVNETFLYEKGGKIEIEHSLLSVSKWEQKYKKPFISKNEKTIEESIDYIKFMTLNDVDESLYLRLSIKDIEDVNAYIEADLTATTFYDTKKKNNSSEPITNELIYYWMVALNIPVEFEKWHLSRLLTLIRVCEVKNEKPEKLSPQELAERNRKLNDERLKKFNTTG